MWDMPQLVQEQRRDDSPRLQTARELGFTTRWSRETCCPFGGLRDHSRQAIRQDRIGCMYVCMYAHAEAVASIVYLCNTQGNAYLAWECFEVRVYLYHYRT